MIELEILKADDHNRIGHYIFYKDQLSFGSSQEDDLLSFNTHTIPKHILFKLKDAHIYVHLNNTIKHIHVNGKKTTSLKKIKTADIIEIADTQMRVTAFSKENNITRKDFLDRRVSELRENPIELVSILQSIE